MSRVGSSKGSGCWLGWVGLGAQMPDECMQRVKEPGKGGAGRACKSCFEGCGICYCCSSSSVSYPELPPTAKERERESEREKRESVCICDCDARERPRQ